jgi:DNA ligase-4
LELTYEKPDKWIDPKDSIIVQVKAVEIVSTDKYKTGCTLRFPRLEKFRDDKPWHQCMKLSELIELKDKNEGKLTSGKHYDLNECDEDGNLIDYENDGEPVSKKKKRNVNLNNVKKATVDSRFRGIDASTVNQIGDIFKGKEFCVINGTNKYDKQQLEKKIAEFGGSLVQNPDQETTFCLIASKVIHKISLYISKGFYDIVYADWLIRCIESKSFLIWKPSDMIYSKPETERMFSKSYDQYGDSYDQDCTVESLKEIFSKMESKITSKKYAKLREQMAEFENEYYPDDSKHGLFRLECFYFDLYENINDGCKKLKNDNGLNLISIKARWHGGLISDFIDENTTKCIVNKE